jgi:hypothetical protein
MKTKIVLLLTVLLLSAATGFAQTSGTCGENLTWTLEDGTLTISGTGEMPDYSSDYAPWYSDREAIISVIIEDGVTSIGSHAFYDCSRLASVTIPNSVTSIGSYAFYNCSSLISVNIPNSVTSIGDGAFYNCFSLVAIDVDANNAAYASENGVLFNKEKTTLIKYPTGKADADYTIPENVISIGERAFFSCNNLAAVTIPNSVTSIGESAFYRCSSLALVTIPNSVTSIGGGAFLACSNLAAVTIPNSVTSIDNSAFLGCSSLTSVTIPNSVTSIDHAAFEVCSSLISVTIPNSVTSIGIYAFYRCRSLTAIDVDANNVAYASENGVLFNKEKTTLIQYPEGKPDAHYSIPNSVTSSGDWAFSNCSSLAAVNIPNSVTSIGERAFVSCSNLTAIDVDANNVAYASENGILFNKEKTTLIQYPAGKTEADYTISESVTSIGVQAFSFCSSLAEVTIPNSVTSIGESAFVGCSSLIAIDVDANNAAYASENGVLFNKEKTTLIQYPAGKTDADYTIPNSVTSIGDYAFYGCNSLKDITVNWSVPLSIGAYVFGGITTAEITLHVPAGTEALYREAAVWGNFNIVAQPPVGQTWNLTPTMTATLLDGTLTISTTQTAEDMPNYSSPSIPPWYLVDEDIVSANIGNGVTSIGIRTFAGCRNLSAVTISNSVTNIGNMAFNSCSSLAAVDIGNSVTSIGESVFFGCSSLATVNIPNSVISIGANAFSYCSSLAAVNIPNSVTSIGNRAFRFCSSLAAVDIGNSVANIGDDAFDSCTSLASVNIPNSVTSIGERAFASCSNLTAIDVDENNASYSSENGVLFNKVKTTLIQYPAGKTEADYTISNSVTSIGNVAFYDCSSLASVTIPNSVTSIGYGAFIRCRSLTSVDIGNSVTSIEDYAFAYCSSLKDITVNWSIPLSIGAYVFEGITTAEVTLYVPAGTEALYRADAVWGGFNIKAISNFKDETEWNDNTGKLSLYSTLLTLQNAISNGYIIITLPAGLSLSADATQVNEAYLTLGEIIQISASQWRINLASRTLRSATENGEPELLIEIGYTASESTPDGDYEVIIDTLELTFDDGTIVKEEEVPVIVNVDRAGTAIANVVKTQLIVSVQNNVLKIGGLSAGDVFSVYNVQGILIYKGTATTSEASVNLPSRGVYIVATDKERAKVF